MPRRPRLATLSLSLTATLTALAAPAWAGGGSAIPSTFRVSLGEGGAQATQPSWSGDISDDGGTVVFASRSPDLVAAPAACKAGGKAFGSVNQINHVYARNLATGRVVCLDRPLDGVNQGTAASVGLPANGLTAVFASTNNHLVRNDYNRSAGDEWERGSDVFAASLRPLRAGTQASPPLRLIDQGLGAARPTARATWTAATARSCRPTAASSR